MANYKKAPLDAGKCSMTSRPDLPPFDMHMELKILEAIAENLHRLANEATEIWRAAVVRAEGTPLLDPLAEQAEWQRGK